MHLMVFMRLKAVIFLLCLLIRFVYSVGTVPVIMFSHKLSPGLLKYQASYNYKQTIPSRSLQTIAEELISGCNSDAYLFINVPGLTEFDLVKYRDEWKYLEQYLQSSSTGLTFEKMLTEGSYIFEPLIEFTQETCHVDKILNLIGNNTAQFEPYLDSTKRIIKIDFPPIDGMVDLQERRETMAHFDKYLRTVIAQLPSPFHTIVLTSLTASNNNGLENSLINSLNEDYTGIFNDIIEEKRDMEKNHRLVDVPLVRNRYRPLHEGLHDEYVSIFDNNFIKENYQLLQIIMTTMGAFFVYQLVNRFTTNNDAKKKTPTQEKILQTLKKHSEVETSKEKEGN